MPPTSDLELARRHLDATAARVDRRLEELRRARVGVPDRLAAAMDHPLTAGGKRFRPALCLAGAEAVGGLGSDVLDAACALEMLHTYSLVHDDLPAMDDDTLRRGRPTCHVVFGEATAILAGDALLTDAFALLAACPGAPERVVAALRELAVAAGSAGMVGGQQRDLDLSGGDLGPADVEPIHAGKTAALLAASVAIGAWLGNGTPAEVAALRRYGHELGMGFQAMDDVLDATSDAAVAGKTPGKDLRQQRPSLVRVLGLDAARARARAHAAAARSELGPLRPTPALAVLRGLVDLAVDRDR